MVGYSGKVPAAPTRTCTACALEKPLSEMERFRKGSTWHYRTRCKACTVQRTRRWVDNNPEKARVRYERAQTNKKQGRVDPSTLPKYILYDSRKSDKKERRENDLDQEFIRKAIKDGCSYCGETDLRMTLDRVDNSLGHLRSNVVAACIRCNYTRKDMPYEAWLLLTPGIRRARETGLFGGWTGLAR